MDETLIAISEEIFQNIISRLTLHLRFMDLALNRYVFVPDALEFRCDGKYFHYSPFALIKAWQIHANEVTRGYFHVVLHSVFNHPYFAEDKVISKWNLACDMAVEYVILELDIPCMQCADDEEKRQVIRKVIKDQPLVTAQNLYRALLERENDEIRLWSSLFQFDMHDPWYHVRRVEGSHDTLFGDEIKDDPSSAGNNRFDKASHDTGERQEKEDPALSEYEVEQIRNTYQDWKEISEKIEMDLELFYKDHKDGIEPMIQSLKQLREEKYNYREFLLKFMRIGEKMELDQNDFDLVFYTYGLQLYHNLPLIEPLEFKEAEGLRELIIVIDTSGSVQGDTVQDFLQKTYNIFAQKEHFFSRFEIHILQCDMEIRDTVVLHNLNDFDAYIQTLEIKGLGGTDFRKPFIYAEEKIRDGVFQKLGGLLYFTDGDGVYPKQKPSFPCAFIFPEGNKDIHVPPWAIRYTLKGD